MTWANYVTNGRVQIPPHLALLNRYLVEVAAGRLKRLIIQMPPRHGKSTTISQWFPAWYLSAFPDNRVILAAYEANFAKTWGRMARNIFAEYSGSTFELSVNDDLAAAAEWGIAGHEGGMITAGIGGAIMGRGANVFLIEDPVKNAVDAMSPSVQQAHLDWFLSTVDTRIEPGGAIVIIMHRWDQRDIVGRLLEMQRLARESGDAEDDEDWVVLSLPAIAGKDDVLGRREGEALWPERYPIDRLERKAKTMSAYWWQALYQQNPLMARGAGSKFSREWFRRVPSFPRGCTRFVCPIDLAASESKGVGHDPDYTAMPLMSECNGEFYIQPHRTRKSPQGTEQWIAEKRAAFGRHVEYEMEQESGASGVTVIDHYAKGVFNGWIFRGKLASGKKELRIHVLSSTAEPLGTNAYGRINIVEGGCTGDFLNEAEEYPTGHDDLLDAAARGIELLTGSANQTHQPTVITPQRPRLALQGGSGARIWRP